MLMRHTKAYSSSCSQIALVYLQPKIAKNNNTTYLGSSWSFKVIYVDTTKKLVTSTYCDRQHSHAYLQPFSR